MEDSTILSLIKAIIIIIIIIIIIKIDFGLPRFSTWSFLCGNGVNKYTLYIFALESMSTY